MVNLFNSPSTYNLKGQFTGYEILHEVTISGSEKFRLPFVLRKGEKSKEFKLELSQTDYNKLTDLALLIYDMTEFEVNSDALGYSTREV